MTNNIILSNNGLPPMFNRAVEAVRKILEQNKNPVAPVDVDHQYEDKYALVEFMTNTGMAATLNVLEQLDGFNEQVLKQVLVVVQDQKRSMTLRLAIEEDCEFLEQTTRTVEMPTTHHHVVVDETTTTSEGGGGTPSSTKSSSKNTMFTHKMTKEVEEFHWKAGIRHTLTLFAGTDPSMGIVLGTRTGTTHLVTRMKKPPYPTYSRPVMDLDLTWLIQNIDKDTMACSFKIDREEAKTPRRNKQTENAMQFVRNLVAWLDGVQYYFQHTVPNQLFLHGHDDKEPSPAQRLYQIEASEVFFRVFAPVLPLFQEYAKESYDDDDGVVSEEQAGLLVHPVPPPANSPIIPLKDTTLFLKEQVRSLQNALLSLMGNFPDPNDQGQLISGYEAKLVLLCLHLKDVAFQWRQGIDYVEQMLYTQLYNAVGKQVKGKDFDEFMKFHNQRIFGKNYTPKPFCHAIRQPNQYPDGVLSIETKDQQDYYPFGGKQQEQGDPIDTFCRHIPGDSLVSPMSIPINAATTVDFLGDQYLHGWMDSSFAGEEGTAKHFISARARQFSCFLLLVGSMSGPDEFSPKDAIILQNKDQVLIPLLTTALPSAKEFRDAIQSLSPEQARFAKSFRSMQLDSSVFGVCVIQVKPQMEALLDLPPNALTKEIQLTQDLLSLFVEYQIPPNLVSYDGEDGAPVAEKVAAVKGHTKGVLEVIKGIKEAQLAEETKKAGMARERHLQSNPRRAESDGGNWNRSGSALSSVARRRCSVEVPARWEADDDDRTFTCFLEGGERERQSLEAGEDDADWGDDLGCEFSNLEVVSKQDKKKKESSNRKQQQGWMVPSSDFTTIPKQLDRMFESFDKEGALRTMTIKTSDDWTRSRQENLLTKMITSQMTSDDKKMESNKAMDLLDALSRSGSLPICSGELHIIIGVRHSFQRNVMATVIEENINPIEKVDYSSLLIGSTVHQVDIPTLLVNSAEPPTLVLKSRQFPPLMIGDDHDDHNERQQGNEGDEGDADGGVVEAETL